MSGLGERTHRMAGTLDSFGPTQRPLEHARAGLVGAVVLLFTAACSSPRARAPGDGRTPATNTAPSASTRPSAPPLDVAPIAPPSNGADDVGPSAREETELETRVRRWADERCPPLEGQEDATSLSRIELVRVGPGRAFATVATRCHLGGGYNSEASVVEVTPDRVVPAEFEAPARNAYLSPDDDLPHAAEIETMTALWNPVLRIEDGVLHVSSAVLERGLGDAGTHVDWRLVRARFVVESIRQRRSQSDRTSDVGPFPIVWPREKRCVAWLAGGPRDHARLVHAIGGRELTDTFVLEGEGACHPAGPERLACGQRVSVLSDAYEYLVVSRDQDWVVLRLGSSESEVLRVPRGCDLPNDGPL